MESLERAEGPLRILMSHLKGRKGHFLYNKKWECDPQYKGWVLLEEIDEIEKKSGF